MDPRATTLKLFGQLILFILAEIVIFLLTHRGPDSVVLNSNQNHDTLVFVQVIFRHGERTPVQAPQYYPKDPHVNYTYEPYGPGELTDKGKQTVLRLGKYLRNYYNDFLGDYHRDMVYAKSSPTPRCRVSLLLLLAGLFPPPEGLALEDDLNWQPIPYDYSSRDFTFMYMFNCKRLIKLSEQYYKEAIADGELKNTKDLIQKLSDLTGRKVNTVRDIFFIYSQLILQKEFGLTLPEWTNEFMPKPLEDFEALTYNLSTRTDESKRLSGGFVLTEIIRAMSSKKLNPDFEKRKIHIYAGHEFTIANLIGTLGFKSVKGVPYGSFFSIEMHKTHNDYAIKLLLYDTIVDYPIVLKLENCQEMCPMEKFLALYSKYMATPEMC